MEVKEEGIVGGNTGGREWEGQWSTQQGKTGLKLGIRQNYRREGCKGREGNLDSEVINDLIQVPTPHIARSTDQLRGF